MNDAFERMPGGIRMQVRVQPRASRNAVIRETGGRIRVALTAPPVDGEANKMLTDFLAGWAGVPRNAVRLVRGGKSRDKVVEIEGVGVEAIEPLFGS